MIALDQLLPPIDEVLQMKPEELAPILLKYLQTQTNINRYNFGNDASRMVSYSNGKQKELAEVLMETWMWLEQNGFLAYKPGTMDEWMFVTRKGKEVVDAQDFTSFGKAVLLPPDGLDPIIIQKVRPTFNRGDYETAIFQAFREIEVRVRKKGGFKASDIGVNLMREAFKPNTGPLSDVSATVGEQEARQQLFAGAIGLLKNPSSHRVLLYTDPYEVVDLIRFANLLLRIVGN